MLHVYVTAPVPPVELAVASPSLAPTHEISSPLKTDETDTLIARSSGSNSSIDAIA